MIYKKKKPKKTSPTLDFMKKSREKEWWDAMKNKKKSPYQTLEEKEKFEELKKKHGIKEQREAS